MNTLTLNNNLLSEYTLNSFVFQNKKMSKKSGIMENLSKYKIKNSGNNKENLSTSVDQMLYGNK